MSGNGKWLFTYGYHNTHGGGLAGSEDIEEIPLTATNEDEAIQEAKAIWKKQQEAAIKRWEAKSGWAHPPKTAFDDGPYNPCVIYKMTLE